MPLVFLNTSNGIREAPTTTLQLMESAPSNNPNDQLRNMRFASFNADQKRSAIFDPLECSSVVPKVNLKHPARAPCPPAWETRQQINDFTTFFFKNPGTWEERFHSAFSGTDNIERNSSSSSFSSLRSLKNEAGPATSQKSPDLTKSPLVNHLNPHNTTGLSPQKSKDLFPNKKRRKIPEEPTKRSTPSQLLSGSPSSILKLLWPSYSKNALRSIREICQTRMIRGLANKGNTCFINVILQSLLSCEPFRRTAMETKQGADTLIQKFNRLAWDMSGYESARAVNGAFNRGKTITPHWFFGTFPSTPNFPATFGTSQEDAEEFLSFLLNKLHEEELSSKASSPKANPSCSGGWDSSCDGQRFLETSISKIFGGSLLDEVRKPDQEPSVREESFFSLSLNISNGGVATIDDALRSYFAAEILKEDYTPIGKPKMIMQKQAFLKRAPQVLILHIKRFSYVNGRLDKVGKAMKFHEVLHIPDSVRKFVNEGEETYPRSYELTAVVTHIGPTLARGHYICGVRLKKPDGESTWVSCNDSIIREVQLKDVLSRQAYLLFYSAI